MVEIFARSLGSTRKHTAHHDGTRTKSKSLHDVSNVADTTVRNDGHTELVRKFRDVVHRGRLGTADSHNLLGNADRAGTHTDTEAVCARGNEACRLLARDDVASDDLKLRERLLDPLDHLNLVDRVALRRVEHDDVESSLDEEAQPLAVGGTSADCRGRIQLLRLGALRRERVVLVLEQVGAREEGRQAALRVDDRELALLRVTENGVRLSEGDALGCGNDVRGHDFGEGCCGGTELDVAISHDTDKLAAQGASIWKAVSASGHTSKNCVESVLSSIVSPNHT